MSADQLGRPDAPPPPELTARTAKIKGRGPVVEVLDVDGHVCAAFGGARASRCRHVVLAWFHPDHGDPVIARDGSRSMFPAGDRGRWVPLGLLAEPIAGRYVNKAENGYWRHYTEQTIPVEVRS